MCWTGSWSVVATAAGVAGTAYAVRRGEPKVRWMTLLFFTGMELLQSFSYIWVGQCDVSANVWLTRMSYIHICLQIPILTVYALSFVSERTRKKWFTPLLIVSSLAGFLMFLRMLIPMIWDTLPAEWICNSARGLCGIDTCTYRGSWHLAWSVRLLNLDAYCQLYFIPVFYLPLLYGNWRWTVTFFLLGPLLSWMMATDNHEWPAVWCFFSVAQLMVMFLTPLRTWLETPLRAGR